MNNFQQRHYKKSLPRSQIYHGYEDLSTDTNYPIWRRQERRSKYAVQLASWQLRSNSPKTSVCPSVVTRQKPPINGSVVLGADETPWPCSAPSWYTPLPLQWRHNGHDGVSNHQPHDCFLSRLFRRRSKKTSKLRVTGLCAGNSPGTGEFPAQMASNTECFRLMTSSCLEWFWVSRRIFIYSHYNTIVFFSKMSVCPSVTPFSLCSHHCIMKFSGVITNDQGEVHANDQGQRSKVKVTGVKTNLSVSRP